MFCQLHKYGFQASLFPGESVNQHIAVNELLEQQGRYYRLYTGQFQLN